MIDGVGIRLYGSMSHIEMFARYAKSRESKKPCTNINITYRSALLNLSDSLWHTTIIPSIISSIMTPLLLLTKSCPISYCIDKAIQLIKVSLKIVF